MKNLLMFTLFFIAASALGQNTEADSTKENDRIGLMQQSENYKSGNYKDAFAKFIQVALKNTELDGNDVEFNATLFGIRSAFNKDLNLDKNFVKEKASRNLQLNMKLNFDEQFDYEGISAGLTYAILNKRDKQVIDLANTEYGAEYEPMRSIISEIQISLALTTPKDTLLINQATEDLINSRTYDKESNKYYDIITNEFKEKAKLKGLSDSNILNYIRLLAEKEEEIFKTIDSKPLWTISASGTALKKSKHRAELSTIFLKGNEKAWYEIDTRAKLTLDDTLSTPTLPNARLIGSTTTLTRSTFNFKVGVNFKVLRDSANRSLFEIKTYGEYNSILKHKLPDEEKDTFLANADFRIRLANDLWMPITVKYDTKNANLLGFLNVTYNFE